MRNNKRKYSIVDIYFMSNKSFFTELSRDPKVMGSAAAVSYSRPPYAPLMEAMSRTTTARVPWHKIKTFIFLLSLYFLEQKENFNVWEENLAEIIARWEECDGRGQRRPNERATAGRHGDIP